MSLRQPLPQALPQPQALARKPVSEDAALLGQVLRGDPTQARRLLQHLARPRLADLPRALSATGLINEDSLAELAAARAGLMIIDPRQAAPDLRLADRWGIARCLADGILPWHRSAQGTVILMQDLPRFEALRHALTACFGPVLPAFAARAAMSETLLAYRGPDIAAAAETRVPARESCRALDARRLSARFASLALPLVLLGGMAPQFLAYLLFGLVVLAVLSLTMLKAAALWASLSRAAPMAPTVSMPGPDRGAESGLPLISLIVALYREDAIAPRLVRRLERLDYPRDRMEVLLVVEEEDKRTRAALLSADLPGWIRIVTAPQGTIRTKPRALNIALDQCRGSVIGVYDAEDAPEPDQLRKVAQAFASAPPEVVCLQGMLDFYNSRKNVMARLFTLEYAVWFRLILPGFDRLRLVLPLGGTTLFFRRAALDQLGAWDAHNVTEDADLGLRLARHGWRTAMLATTTHEEANCRPLPWIRQRSRWIKGYMMTWAVHMRQPGLLWRELGPRRFLAVQAHFAGSVTQALLAPLLWSLWLMPFGIWHPLTAWLPEGGARLIGPPLLLAMVIDVVLAVMACQRLDGRLSAFWVLAQPAYHALATLAAYKALWEMARRPFFWDKTAHGRFGG